MLTATDPSGARTYQTYSQKDVVDYYDGQRDLQPAESVLFDAYVEPGQRILDIGVGAGRTARYLAPGAAKYVGIDYAEAMVERCKQLFPNLEFHTVDATDMSRFEDASFDVVVFSFNGLGTLPNDEAREKCLAECARVLKKGGIFIFSLHNPRFVLYPALLKNVGLLKKAWRITYAARQTSRNLYHRISTGAFWRGSGYVVDPGQHNALTVYVCEPKQVAEAVRRHGFEVLRTVAGPVERFTTFATPHFYYACKKT
jgi:ubiquinone/menaquinone biosynthesis C-methylase UbiE